MKPNFATLFLGLSIAITYSVCVNQLVFTDQFHELFDKEVAAAIPEYYKVENKYRLMLGEKSEAGQKAQNYFHEHIIPKMFKQCSDGYYSIYHQQNSEYIPPIINVWYERLYKKGHTRYYSSYYVHGVNGFTYAYKIHEQSQDYIDVIIDVYEQSVNGYLVGSFHVYLDYSYEVIKVEGAHNTGSLPIYGSGKPPQPFSCEYLQAHNGSIIN